MVYELKDTSKVKELFAGCQDTLIYSCLQKGMGKIYGTPEGTRTPDLLVRSWSKSF